MRGWEFEASVNADQGDFTRKATCPFQLQEQQQNKNKWNPQTLEKK